MQNAVFLDEPTSVSFAYISLDTFLIFPFILSGMLWCLLNTDFLFLFALYLFWHWISNIIRRVWYVNFNYREQLFINII